MKENRHLLMDSAHKGLVMRIAGGFLTERVSNGEFVSMSWRHNVLYVPGVFSTRCGVPAGCRLHGGSGIGTVIMGRTIIGSRKWLEWNWEILHKMAMSSLLKSCELCVPIRSQFCTCHDSSAAMTCEKLWTDRTITFSKIFYKIRMMS